MSTQVLRINGVPPNRCSSNEAIWGMKGKDDWSCTTSSLLPKSANPYSFLHGLGFLASMNCTAHTTRRFYSFIKYEYHASPSKQCIIEYFYIKNLLDDTPLLALKNLVEGRKLGCLSLPHPPATPQMASVKCGWDVPFGWSELQGDYNFRCFKWRTNRSAHRKQSFCQLVV